MDIDAEKLAQSLIEKQIERAYSQMKDQNPERESQAINYILERENPEEDKIVFNIEASSSSSAAATSSVASTSHVSNSKKAFQEDDEEEDELEEKQRLAQELEASKRHGKTKNLDEILRIEDERRKAPSIPPVIEQRKKIKVDYWLFPHIIVRVINKKLADGKYYKAKGIVQKVIEKYGAEIKMIDSGDLLQLDQDDLETVIPPVDDKVLILNGMYSGLSAKVRSLDKKTYNATVEISEGNFRNQKISLPFEDISSLSESPIK